MLYSHVFCVFATALLICTMEAKVTNQRNGTLTTLADSEEVLESYFRKIQEERMEARRNRYEKARKEFAKMLLKKILKLLRTNMPKKEKN